MGLESKIQVAKTVAIIGGGFSGSVLALKLAAAWPDWTILLVEQQGQVGRGLAYGACEPHHILNVPVNRMEVGLKPSFTDWLRARPGLLARALEESGGDLESAFIPRQLFGDYLAQRLDEALHVPGVGPIRRLHGAAVGISEQPRAVILADGRRLPCDLVVLATGNLPSSLPFGHARSDRIVHNPWTPGALSGVEKDSTVLLVGSGLTMVDMVLSLRARGHAGHLVSFSRHGLLPRAHRAGGNWQAFLNAGMSPLEAFKAVRAQVRQARNQSIPWQRVFDAARPAAAALWQNWTLGQRAQFLRHLRSRWDVHRHRMTPRVAAVIDDLTRRDILEIVPGRILAMDEHARGVTVFLRPRGETARTIEARAVINCTGPQADPRRTGHPLLHDLMRQNLACADPLGLGLDSEDGALRRPDGSITEWLYALGPLVRPAWWEITAVPEINAQIDRLVQRIGRAQSEMTRPLSAIFQDIGAGI